MKRIIGLVGVGLLTVVAFAQIPVAEMDVPSFHKTPPKTPQKPILAGDQLTGEYFRHDYQVAAYKMANEVPDILYQLPCYCRCDMALGHKSLRSCYEDTHGATCSICMREAVYAYQEKKKGKTAAQIRAGIERADYLPIDLENIKMQ